MDDRDQGEKLDGKYANIFKVGYNAYEFILDFGQYYTGQEEKYQTRIVTGPAYAKTLLKTLQEAIDNFEKDFGTI